MLQLNDALYSPETIFDFLLERLLYDTEFRTAFFNDPKRSIEKSGVKLTPEMAISLGEHDWLQIVDRNMAYFNEKLVLCASSGY